MKFNRREIMVFVGIAIIFIALRLPGIHLPLHQDEYKWPIIVNPALTAPGGIPHPPLGEFIYKTAGQTIGYDNFRVVPLLFSFLNLLLLFYLVKNLAGSKAAFWSIFLFAISFYSVLASLMVDTDGAIMPFFFLIMAIGYVKLKASNFELVRVNWKWLAVLIVGAIGGILVKVSAVLPIIALVLDFAFDKNIFADKKRIAKYFGFGILGVLAVAVILFASKFIFPYFNLDWSIKYWEHFANSSSFLNRGWLQTFIQFVKSLLYSSPLLLLPALLFDREIFKKTRPFLFFIFVGLVFYLFAFDFSLGALDRYLEFLIVPLCVISGTVLAKFFKYNKEGTIPVLLISVLIFSLQFFNHFVPTLYPKTEWINRVFSLKWDFLFPFNGGSGPLPFYISFMFMALIWVCSVVFALSLFKFKNMKTKVLFSILVLGIMYNGVFAEEYLFGKINGSTSKLINDSVAFIKKDNDVKMVTVYNDNGGYDVMQTGKYRKRLYIDPKFDINEKIKTLNQYKEHYLVVNIPRIDPESVYARYFNSCQIIYKESDKYISATIYDCRNAPNISIK